MKGVRFFSRIGRFTHDDGSFSGSSIMWKKDKGDIIGPDDVVAVLETDKMCFEVRGEYCGITHPVVLEERLIAEESELRNNEDLFVYDEVDQSTSVISLSLSKLGM